MQGTEVVAEFADGYRAQGHFLVGADGIGSATRRLLDPVVRPPYGGYVAWRGLEPESAMPGDLLELLTGRFTFFGADGLQMLCYLVPGPDAHHGPWIGLQPRQIPVGPKVERASPTVTRYPRKAPIRLTAAACALAPKTNRMVADHAALIGDAAGTVRPHTASGTPKAFADAAGLATARRGWTPEQDLPAARLAGWERDRLSHLVALSHTGIDLANRSALGTADSRRFFVPA
ncbi:FAD binding domain-containing protein [Streptomyces misionensis]|uniref:FAD binding domain-containing protein n=1 Tax=Streptomyces misionensis TaxID=67331 RepID=UPI003F4D17D2